MGQLLERAASVSTQVLPTITQVSSQLQRESSLQENRVDLQQTISRLVPVLQQLGLTINQLSAALGTVRLGENPGQATVTEVEVNRPARIAVHVSSDGSIRPNPNQPNAQQDPANPNSQAPAPGSNPQ